MDSQRLDQKIRLCRDKIEKLTDQRTELKRQKQEIEAQIQTIATTANDRKNDLEEFRSRTQIAPQ